MTVRDTHGEKLGTVEECRAQTFVVSKGFPFEKRFEARYDGIAEVRGDEIWMDQAGPHLEAQAYATPLGEERQAES
ncbi:MAG TPA: hypothetical protein RMH99_25230 [Sandaracinaceae bacterium LLY-WYZ-13_1]|nr:hypothetical protein [Sandaracinaceae bacterium LLY-WYZ-13_1]